MISTGVKTDKSDQKITEKFVGDHINIGIESLRIIRDEGRSVKHLHF
jgi:AMP nucleosidase